MPMYAPDVPGTAPGAAAGRTAARAPGADIEILLDVPVRPITEASHPQRASVQFAGRAVIEVAEGPDASAAAHKFACPTEDVLWVTQAEEPALSELIRQLP